MRGVWGTASQAEETASAKKHIWGNEKEACVAGAELSCERPWGQPWALLPVERSLGFVVSSMRSHF